MGTANFSQLGFAKKVFFVLSVVKPHSDILLRV